jgi:hypothetical protein
MKTTLVIGALLAILATTIGWAIWGWKQTANITVSVHGYIAMILGIVFTLLVGCGLMALMFYSSRHGYDDAENDRSDADRD